MVNIVYKRTINLFRWVSYENCVQRINNNDKDKILDINQKLFVQNLPKETRIGAKQMGTRMVKLALDLYESEWIQWYYDQMKSHKIQLHPAVCFTMLGHDLGVNVESIIDYYLYQNISSLTQNAVKSDSFRTNSWAASRN